MSVGILHKAYRRDSGMHTVQISKINNGNASNSIDVPAADTFLALLMLQSIKMGSFFAEIESRLGCLGVQIVPAMGGASNAFLKRLLGAALRVGMLFLCRSQL